ncbi:MAG: D-aminoacyl-tRNA deacylase [Roseiflexaceae bacterium]|nr:D-aminoacyl-tRNA deacylase [Roseiflexaceae bacterium]
MRAVIQRVNQASVTISNEIVGQIGDGLLILLGIAPADDQAIGMFLAEKIANLRIFPDQAGRFDRSLIDIGGAALVVSQFTLFADTRRGRRPSFSDAAPPEQAALRVEDFVLALRQQGVFVAAGRFGAHMQVALVNDGPVTIILDSETFREPRRS